ncbi:MAG: LPP20 family lipoprotein [Balneolales bacterium]|nr:LPP20 family lipoprotein [Balneolales bacterium]
MKKSVAILLCLAGAFFLLSCGSSSSTRAPLWLTSPGEVYAESRYLTAIGSGPSLQQAQNSAYGNLARIFRADVQANQTMVDDFLETMSNEDVNLERITSLISTTRIESNLEVLNVQTYETYFDGETHYVLAGFERLRTSTIYSREMANNEMVIDNLRSRANSEQSIIKKLGLLRSAKLISDVNVNLSQQRDHILNRSVPFNPEVETRIEIETEIEQLKRQATVRIRNSERLPNELNSALRSVFQGLGFTMGDSVTNPLLEIIPNFEKQPANIGRDDAYFIAWNLSIDIIDNQTRTDFRQFSHSSRSGAISADQADRRTTRDAKETIEKQFKTFLDSQLRNLIK